MTSDRETPPDGVYVRDFGFGYGVGFTLKAMLREGFSSYGALAWKLLAISFLAAAVDLAAGILLPGGGGAEVGGMAVPGLSAFLSIPFGLAAWAGAFILLDERARGLKARSAGSALWRGFRFFGTYFAIAFLMGIAIIPALIPGTIFYGIEMKAVGIPLLVVGGIVDLYLLIRWSLAQVVAVLEGVGATNSMSRSGALLKGRLPRVIVFLAITGGINTAGMFLVRGAFRLAEEPLGLSDGTADMAATGVDTLVFSPIAYCLTFALYAALRGDLPSRLRAGDREGRRS